MKVSKTDERSKRPLVHGHALLAAGRAEVDQGGVLQAEIVRRLVADAQGGGFVHFHTVAGFGHLDGGHGVRLHLHRKARRAGVLQAVEILDLDDVGVVLHDQQLAVQFLAVGNGQGHFVAGLEAQAAAGKGHVGAHAEAYLGAGQRLDVAAALLHLLGQAGVVGEQIAQHQLADGRVGHHFQRAGLGGVAAADRLEAQRRLRFDDGVAEDAGFLGFHVIPLRRLAVALQADLHAARQPTAHLRLHVEVAALGDDRLLRLDGDLHGGIRQVGVRLGQHAPRLVQGAGLQAADANRGEHQHGAPRHALQAPAAHHVSRLETGHLTRDAPVQRLHQVERHAVRIGARQCLGVQLQGVAQVVVRAGIGLLDARQGLLLRHPAHGRPQHVDDQRQHGEHAHGAVDHGGQRQPGDQRLHRHAQQQQRQGHRAGQHAALQQTALIEAALHPPHELGENAVILAHGVVPS